MTNAAPTENQMIIEKDGGVLMARTGKDLGGFLAAVDLLLDESAWLAWAAQPRRVQLSREQRIAVADFLSVVGGDGTHRGTLADKRIRMGDGDGWVAPSSSGVDEASVWHAVVQGDAEGGFRSACGVDHLAWELAVPVASELGSRVRWCGTAACQMRIAA